MKQGLIIIDVQNDYFPGGNMELVSMESAASNAGLILEKFRGNENPVFHIQHLSKRPGSTFFLPGTRGAEIHESVNPLGNETIIEKLYPNAFRETPLLNKLKDLNIREVVLCGAMSHMCVDATTRAAFDNGFNCTVIHDACATRDLVFNGENVEAAKVHASFMAALSSPYAKVISVNEFN